MAKILHSAHSKFSASAEENMESDNESPINLHNSLQPSRTLQVAKRTHCGTAVSRKDFLEKEELKHCTFQPAIGEVSKILAEKRRRSKDQEHALNPLADDAKKRHLYKQKIDKIVVLFCM